MIEAVIKDSARLEGKINLLNSVNNGGKLKNGTSSVMVKLTKYEIFLVLTHMFLGTWPSQLFNSDVSFGPLMATNDNED